MMRYITEHMIDEVNEGIYTILVRAESTYQEKDYTSDNCELILGGMDINEANKKINDIAERLIKLMLPNDIDAIGQAKNYVVITKAFKNSADNEELPRKTLIAYTSARKF